MTCKVACQGIIGGDINVSDKVIGEFEHGVLAGDMPHRVTLCGDTIIWSFW